MSFNTSKSNRHLWDNISLKMRGKGFDRSPAMYTDKWRNLLKEFKKAKQNNSDNGNGYAKMSYYKEIGEILSERNKSSAIWKNSEIPNNSGGSKVDSFMQFADKGVDDASLTFGPVEERRLDHDGHPLAITAADAVGSSGVSPWNWRETPGSGEQTNNPYGRVITVKLGDYTKRIGIDASGDAIEKAIKSAFRLRTKRAFWLEEDNVVPSLDRDMPLGNYSLHVDEERAFWLEDEDNVARSLDRDMPLGNYTLHVDEERAFWLEDEDNVARSLDRDMPLGNYTLHVDEERAFWLEDKIMSLDHLTEICLLEIILFMSMKERAFWLEDEDNVARSLDRDMPLGNYTLHVDEGLTIKVCVYEETDTLPVHTVDKTFYSDEDFHDFLSRRGWTCLREYNGFWNVDSVDDLCPGAIYRGVN
ncbi:hypothetical protein OROGR_010087 [Orobanche gracilis]